MKKRYQAIDLTDLALGIIIMGIVVSIGANILVQYADNRVDNLPTVEVANESFTMAAESTYDFTNLYFNTINECLDSNNGTAAVIVNTDNANYTVTTNSFGEGTIDFVTGASALNATTVYCNYDIYNLSDPQYNVPNLAADGLAEYGNWFDILVIVGVASVILALIFLSFGKSKSTQIGGQSY